ncbi:MAG: nucleotidyltransferase domain-containing protein, partial [Nanoarchaeota archaeon]|nr:nucleotidyltransferase domain-containing protein [Nanoarchaeota archaeon]
MKLKNSIRALAYSFISYILEKIEFDRMNKIILFGSVARGDADEESDIDIFIDTNDKNLKGEITDLTNSFYNSTIYKDYWLLLGVKNEVKCIVSKLDEWQLNRSIISEGITLFDKTVSKINGKFFAMFKISIKGEAKRKLKLWRMLYGYNQKVGKKIYSSEGLIKKYNGKKISQGVFIIPLSKSQTIMSLLRKEKIKYSI